MKMTDAEKGLRQHCEGSMLDRCGECPYHEPDYNNPCAGIDCRDKLIIDIAELMKAQEPVKPEQQESPGGAWWYKCGNCQTAISPGDNYCRGCGREIDWSK